MISCIANNQLYSTYLVYGYYSRADKVGKPFPHPNEKGKKRSSYARLQSVGSVLLNTEPDYIYPTGDLLDPVSFVDCMARWSISESGWPGLDLSDKNCDGSNHV